jgi:hypothetical protein
VMSLRATLGKSARRLDRWPCSLDERGERAAADLALDSDRSAQARLGCDRAGHTAQARESSSVSHAIMGQREHFASIFVDDSMTPSGVERKPITAPRHEHAVTVQDRRAPRFQTVCRRRRRSRALKPQWCGWSS